MRACAGVTLMRRSNRRDIRRSDKVAGVASTAVRQRVPRSRARGRDRRDRLAAGRRVRAWDAGYLARARASIGLRMIASGMVARTPMAMPAIVLGTPKRSPNNPTIGGATADAPAVPV